MERLREDLEALRGMQRDGLVSTHEAAQLRSRLLDRQRPPEEATPKAGSAPAQTRPNATKESPLSAVHASGTAPGRRERELRLPSTIEPYALYRGSSQPHRRQQRSKSDGGAAKARLEEEDSEVFDVVHDTSGEGEYGETETPSARASARAEGSTTMPQAIAASKPTRSQNALAVLVPPNAPSVYGFVGWVISLISFLLFLGWAYFPDETLVRFGVTYYPSRYWAIAGPAYACVCVAFTPIFYNALNLMRAPRLDSYDTFTDKYAIERPKVDEDEDPFAGASVEVYDIPISEINLKLFSAV